MGLSGYGYGMGMGMGIPQCRVGCWLTSFSLWRDTGAALQISRAPGPNTGAEAGKWVTGLALGRVVRTEVTHREGGGLVKYSRATSSAIVDAEATGQYLELGPATDDGTWTAWT